MKRCFFAVVVSLALIVTSCSKSSDNGGGGGLLSKAESALTPSDPWTEFALMMAAKSKATSWRSKVVMDQGGKPMEMDSEVMCPDKQHTKMTQGGTMTMESYIIGSTMYVNMGGRMIKTNNPMSAAMLQCGGTPSGSSSGGSPKGGFGSLPSVKDITSGLENLEKAKQNTQITKGGVSTVEGSTCQEWNVVYNDPASKQSYTSNFCIGIADHLPRRMIMNRGAQGQIEMTYWDWNSNINIAPPTT